MARKYLPGLAASGLTPAVVGWGVGYVTLRSAQPLTDWLVHADATAIRKMRPLVIDLVDRIHSQGLCHRDLHIENLLVLDERPVAIDFEHAYEVDPSWPCYDFTGPSAQVPLLQAHAQFGGILGSTGIWWGAKRDPRWNGRYVPLGLIFGPLE